MRAPWRVRVHDALSTRQDKESPPIPLPEPLILLPQGCKPFLSFPTVPRWPLLLRLLPPVALPSSRQRRNREAPGCTARRRAASSAILSFGHSLFSFIFPLFYVTHLLAVSERGGFNLTALGQPIFFLFHHLSTRPLLIMTADVVGGQPILFFLLLHLLHAT